MRKIKVLLIMMFICSVLLFPTINAKAETSTEIFYPAGINDYVDLNNIEKFAIYENKIFYNKSDNKIICYDKETKESTTLVTLKNSDEIYNLCAEGNYLFVFTNTSIYVYNLDTLSNIPFQHKISYGCASVNYVNDKYYIGFIDNSTRQFKVWILNKNLTIDNNSYYYPQTFSYSTNNIISFSDSLIVVKPITGEKIYLFNYPTDSATLNPIESGSSNPYFNIDGFNSETTTDTIAVLDIDNNSYTNSIFIGYGSTNTKICKFNNSTLSYTSDNNLVSDKITICNNILYVYNENTANICTYDYNISNDSFTLKDLILAGKGSEIGRFKNVSDLTYKNNTLYATDTGNNRVQILSKEKVETKSTSGKVTEVVVDNYNNYYYASYNGTNSILYKNGSFLKSFNKNIISIAISLDNTIYALTLDNKIIHYINSSNTPEITLAQSVNENSKIRINNNYLNLRHPISSVVAESRINVSVDKNIYRFNNSGQVEKTLSFDNNIIDYHFNGAVATTPVYALLSNGDFVKSSFTEASDKNIKLSGFNNYSAFSMDITSGEIQMYNNKLSAIEVYNNSEFSSTCTLAHYDNNAYNSSGFTEVWQYAQIKTNSDIYDYYYYLGKSSKLSQTTNVIVLNANEEFAYVAYDLNNCLKFGYVNISDFVDGIKPMALSNTTYKLRITNKNVSVFKYPSIYNDLNFYSLAQGQIVDTYGKYVNPIDNNEYYIVKIGSQYGYVCSNNVVLNENISRNIRTNAKIKIFDGGDKISVYATNEDGASVICKLSDGYKIYANDYNKDSKYTRITFIDEDQQEREGYVLTKYVKLNGLSNSVITAIVLLAIDIVIAVIVIIFFTHYKKKQKEKENKNDLR